jgi:anti-sigma factor RsiW
MDCREFRETYTDLLDGLLGETDEIRFHEHLAACPRCRRFDQAYRLGVSALRGLPCPRTSRAFTARVLHAARTDPSGALPSFAAGFAGAALVVALIGFLAVDLGVMGRRKPAASADFSDSTFAASAPDSAIDLITFRLRDAAYDLPFWDPYAPVQARDANLSSRVRFAVPAVWTGR